MKANIIQIKPVKREDKSYPRIKDYTEDKDIKAKTPKRALVKSGRYMTGLNEVDKTYPDSEGNQDKLTEKEYYSMLTGMNLDSLFKPGKAHKYWDTSLGKVDLPNFTLMMDISDPHQYIKYKILYDCNTVANSEAEIQNEHTHYIYSETEGIEKRAKHADLVGQATIKCFDLTVQKKKQILVVINKSNLRNKEDSYITAELHDLINKDPKLVLEYLQKDATQLAVSALVETAIMESVLDDRGIEGIFYGGDKLGESKDTVILKLSSPENQNMRIIIKQALQS